MSIFDRAAREDVGRVAVSVAELAVSVAEIASRLDALADAQGVTAARLGRIDAALSRLESLQVALTRITELDADIARLHAFQASQAGKATALAEQLAAVTHEGVAERVTGLEARTSAMEVTACPTTPEYCEWVILSQENTAGKHVVITECRACLRRERREQG